MRSFILASFLMISSRAFQVARVASRPTFMRAMSTVPEDQKPMVRRTFSSALRQSEKPIIFFDLYLSGRGVAIISVSDIGFRRSVILDSS